MHGIINTYMYVRIICFQICTSCILYTYNVQTDCRVRKRASKSFDFWKDFRESKGSGMRLIHFIYLSFFLDAVSDLVKACLASFELNSFLHRESFGILPFLLLTIALESKCRGLLLFTRDIRGGQCRKTQRKKKSKLSSSLFLLRRYFSSPLTNFNALLHPVKRTYCVCGYM